LEDRVKKCQNFKYSELDEMMPVDTDGKKNIVFLDGYAQLENSDNHDSIQRDCYDWFQKNKNKRRLVVVCSMSTLYKAKPEDFPDTTVEQFFVYSWKKEEYLKAVLNDDFFNSVFNILDSSNDLQLNETTTIKPTREEVILSKFYFAGGCSRFMFRYTTKQVISYLQASVEEIRNIVGYNNATIGARSNGVINRFFGLHLTGYVQKTAKSFVISEFAGFLAALKMGPELVKNLSRCIGHDSNPAMNGWMLEMWFFASLRKGGVKFWKKGERGLFHWAEVASVEILDMDCFQVPDAGGVWLKPQKWNQGGYDAVLISRTIEEPIVHQKPKVVVKFVQVTRAEAHSFKIGYFHSFLKVLKDHFVIDDIEIFFLVEKSNLSTFKIPDSQISGQGLLHEFGWLKYKEKEKLQIIGVEGWKDPR
jgi:hypothetical protein